MTAPQQPPETPTPQDDTIQPVRWPWRLFFVFLGLYVLTSRGHTGSIDEESLLFVSSTMVQGAATFLNITLLIPDPPWQGSGVFTSYEPGQPLLAIPFYLAGSQLASFFPLESHTYVTRLVATLFGAVVSAATVARLYQCGRVLGQVAGAATFMAITCAVGTLAWPYARTFYREPLVALALLSAVYALVRWRKEQSWRLALVGSGWALLAVATKLAALIALPLFAAYITSIYFKQRRSSASGQRLSVLVGKGPVGKQVSTWVVTAAVLVAIIAVGGLVLLGRWAQIGPYLGQIGLFTGDLSYVPVALYGLTLSPGKGLVVFAPPVLAALAGLYLLYRTHRAEALLLGGVFGVFLVVYSFNTSWHGGASWGPRYLLPVLPLLILPLGMLVQSLWAARSSTKGQVGLLLVANLLVAGVVVQVAGISVDPVNYYLDVLSRRSLTLEGGPAYLQEIHFDPALSPITGHLALAAEYSGNLVAKRNRFRQVPFERDPYLQYFRDARSLDFAPVHLYEWWRASR